MPLTEDGNGNLFATWSPDTDASSASVAGPGGVLTGSHFDSVPHGGAYDGPLGIVSAFLAVDLLRERGFRPVRPITVAAFAEEEGSRFGVACLGSRLLTGAIDPERAAALTDRDGLALGDVFGAAPAGARPDLVASFDAYVELHVEQGRALTGPVGVASAIWPHGRWRFDVEGEGNHAGTTLMTDRRDPMLTYAFTVLAANKEARLRGAHATVGRVEVTPNATNAIPAAVRGWLDARAADDETLAGLVEAVAKKATERAGRDGTGIRFTAESTTARGPLRRHPGRPPGRAARRCADPADRCRARRRRALRPPAHGDAVRPQPDRGQPRPGGVSHRRRLRGRRPSAGPGPGGTVRPATR